MSTERIDWVISSCRLLAAIGEEFDRTRPFAGMTIGTGIHLEPKTAALLLTLQRGGARMVSTGNLNSTQPATVEYLRARGVEVIGEPTSDPVVHADDLRGVLAEKPHLILDNGGDLFAQYLADPYPGLTGGTEETTSGRDRLLPLRDRLGVPVLVINDSPIKQFAENTHAVGQSVFETYMRLTNRSTQGKRVAVFGYGSVGRGVAASFRNAFALVTVLERDPVLRLEACLDGFDVSDADVALPEADVVITVTGAPGVLTLEHLPLLRSGVILMNAGHFPHEIDVDAFLAAGEVAPSTAGIDTITLPDGRRIHLAGRGHMVNLSGPAPLGNSIESMDLGFALQSRCLEAVARGDVGTESVVVPVPRRINDVVASAYLRDVVRVTA
ncbi:MAG TPA: adenosylhomocysteinase [Pseudolysinimonas sp.]|jgi:adenosylhomocysteinase|nr:adenosylhomocysteinase [Pseudolysinimonas sp.]